MIDWDIPSRLRSYRECSKKDLIAQLEAEMHLQSRRTNVRWHPTNAKKLAEKGDRLPSQNQIRSHSLTLTLVAMANS